MSTDKTVIGTVDGTKHTASAADVVAPINRSISIASRRKDVILQPTTPYAHLLRIVLSYGRGPFDGDLGAKYAVYDAALAEYRGREADFTDADLVRVIDAAGRA